MKKIFTVICFLPVLAFAQPKDKNAQAQQRVPLNNFVDSFITLLCSPDKLFICFITLLCSPDNNLLLNNYNQNLTDHDP